MAKRLAALVLAAVFLLMSGCTSLFKKEYLSIAEYTDEAHNESRSNTKEVSTYGELKNVLEDMVRNHVEEERVQFTGYEGNVRNDLSQARREVEEETPLGGFAVDYIADDLRRIVTYYQATITVHYKRSEAEIAAITYIVGEKKLFTFLDETMSSLKQYAAIRMISADLTEAYFIDAVSGVFDANPVSCVLGPEVTVTIHPASGSDCIIELEFDYGRTATVLGGMRRELSDAIADVVSGIGTRESGGFALESYHALAGIVSYDPDGEIRKAAGGLVASLNTSVYGALVEGIADSHGIALAYSALCREAGIECIVVRGTLDKTEHSWNIIKLDEGYYHVDISADASLGVNGAFARSDDQMRISYWWNIDYPECPSYLNAADIFAGS